MFELIKARIRHGWQAIPDPLHASIHPAFPGVPVLLGDHAEDFEAAEQICPTHAIQNHRLDLGKCVFCGACERGFPETFSFEADFRLASSSREGLIIRWDEELNASSRPGVSPHPVMAKVCRNSLALRNVSAAGCNACELELGACSNVNFDMGRYGLDVVASPRHADALILTGPVSANMAMALRETWEAIPAPKVLILSGTCAISGGLFSNSDQINRDWLDGITPALYIPGCPAHPLSIIHGLMSLLGRAK